MIHNRPITWQDWYDYIQNVSPLGYTVEDICKILLLGPNASVLDAQSMELVQNGSN